MSTTAGEPDAVLARKREALISIIEVAQGIPRAEAQRVIAAAAIFFDVDRSLLKERDVVDLTLTGSSQALRHRAAKSFGIRSKRAGQ